MLKGAERLQFGPELRSSGLALTGCRRALRCLPLIGQLLRQRALAVAVGVTIEAVIDGRERAVYLGESGRFADQRLKRLARPIEAACCESEQSQLIADA